MLTLLIVIAFTPALVSCGSLHSYWGVENEYYSDGDGGHRYRKPPKHKKHKKCKKPKHRKHHHDHDDDDDD